MSKSREIKIVAVIGSVQPDNLTSQALSVVIDQIKKSSQVTVEIIDPTQMELTLPGKEEGASTAFIRKAISQATAVILATPEYHGSYSSVIKLIIDNLGYPSALSGKPVSLLGVASGEIGAIKALEHLRSVCSHVGAIVLPNVVSIARVHTVFDQAGHCTDPKIEKRLRALGAHLIEHIETHCWPHEAQEEDVRNL